MTCRLPDPLMSGGAAWRAMQLYEFALLAFSSLFVIADPIAMKIASRLMGLLLAAIACQFFVNALRDLKLIPPN